MTTTPNPSFDLDALRATQKKRGEKHLWRGLEDLADTAEHRAFLEHEFPNDPEKDAASCSPVKLLMRMTASIGAMF